MKHIPLDPSTLALVAATGVAGSLMSRHTAFFSPEGRISRRGLIGHGGLGLTVLATAGWRSYSARAAENGRSSVTLLPSGSAALAAACVLTPEQTEGPYYIPKEKIRSNLVEHRPGTPLRLRLAVVDASTCSPLKGAAVDIWHCDATGIYSGFESAKWIGGQCS